MEYGCIGEHLSHSFSKILHNKIGGYDYILKEIPKDSLADFIKSKDFKGINITIPYKVDVIPFLDEIDFKAKEIGAVNTIVNRDGRLYGYNTDFDGMIALINKLGIIVKNKNVLILGTGGTSKTAYAVAKYLKAKSVTKVSRTKKENAITYEEASKNHKDTEIIINTTPCGMFPKIDASPIDISNFPKLEGVVDCIYNPLFSKLIKDAKKRNIKSGGGLYMLTAQAVFAAEKFFQEEISQETIDRVYGEVLKEKLNIVLIGMPGCGKTEIGKLLSEILNKRFVDTDLLITELYKKTPAEIIREDGEEKFRELEALALDKIKMDNNSIIATGGGIILKEENIDKLKSNSKIYFIKRPIENIVPTSDRPLSSNRADLLKLYEKRKPLYKKYSEVTIDNNASVIGAVNKILQDFERTAL